MPLDRRLSLNVASGTAPLQPGDSKRSLAVGSRLRSYLVHVPPGYDGHEPIPVVLAFHGGGSNALMMSRFSGLDEKADAARFLVVYPEGSGPNENTQSWNGGNCCGYAMMEQVEDVEFVRVLLTDLASIAVIDQRRIYVTGMSNGAVLSYRLASELSDRIAAIAPVAGPMGTDSCHPNRPVPVLHMHGTIDHFAPYEGGYGSRSQSRVDFYSVEHSLNCWIRANGCPSEPQVTELLTLIDDGTRVFRKVWGPGRDGAEVVLYLIEGGGHTWPGREPRLAILGKATANLDANDVIWEFFQKHPLPATDAWTSWPT